MNQERIDLLVREGVLRLRKPDKEKIHSLLLSAKINANVIKNMKLNDENATVVFREIYESIRQLGDALWWKMGYEPTNHEISLDSLKYIDIPCKFLFNHLGRYRQIRNDVNYRGFKVTFHQAREILDLWNECSEDIILKLCS